MIRRTLFIVLIAAAAINMHAAGMKIVYYHANGRIEARTFGDQLIDATTVGSGDVLDMRGGRAVPVIIADPNPVLYTYKWEDLTFTDNTDYAAIKAFEEAIKGLPKLFENQQRIAQRANNTLPEPTIVTEVKKLKEMIDSMDSIAAQTCGSAADVTAAKDKVKLWDLVAVEKAINGEYKRIDEASLTALARGDAGEPIDNLAKQLESKVRDMLAAAKSFKANVNAVNEPKELGTVPYDMSKNPTVHITIQPVKGFEDIAAKCGRATGKQDIPLQPFFPVHFSMEPGMVYSFVKAPTFSAKKQNDGTLKIAQTDSDYRAQSIAAMLTLTPRTWNEEPTFGRGFQIGISPVKDQIGFFAGGWLRLADLVKLGAGFAWQQVPRLDKGLKVGDPVASPDDVKTTPEFKSGGYIGVTITLPSAKK